MTKINYELEKELLIYETLKKSINEIKIYYKNNPDSRIINKKSIIPYLEQQIVSLKNINKFEMSIFNHFLYNIKRISNILEIHRLNGTLKTRLRISLFFLYLGAIITTNYSSSQKEELLTAEEQHTIMDNLCNTIKNITTEFDEKFKEEETKKLKEKIEFKEDVRNNECENFSSNLIYSNEEEQEKEAKVVLAMKFSE